MSRWWSDTLFKRLFALMWIALVASHLVAVTIVRETVARSGPGEPGFGRLPMLLSLPPMQGGRGDGGPPRGPGPGSRMQGMPATALLLDYGIRFFVIGLAAWWGARWLSKPMGRLSTASRSLGTAIANNERPAVLDAQTGTVEVRDAAKVFNEMSDQLYRLVHARSLLVAAISHDLRTPLTRMRMRLEGSEGDPVAARSISDIHEMDELIESALEIFRGQGSGEAASLTDVHALVQSITDDLAELGQPVTLIGQPAQARVQPAALRRVVSNLINNALRYGERAEVSVGCREGSIDIHVDDFGPGIPPNQLEAVLEPFYRLETSRNRTTGGSGLGLYIARDLVVRQGGRLVLSNRPMGGLRATISLPVG
jgi:protein-histidine pros-kinase